MNGRIIAALVCLIVLASSPHPSALADEAPDSCSAPCQGGKIKSSFLDGKSVSCLCLDPAGGMVDDTATNYGGSGPEAEAQEH